MWETPTQSSKINWPIFLDTQEAVISMILLLMTSSCWRRNDVWCSSSNNNNNNSKIGNNDSTGNNNNDNIVNNHPSAAATKSRQPSPANFSGLQRNLGTSLSDRLKSKKDLFWRETKKLWRSIYLSSQKVEIARNDEKLILCCLDKKSEKILFCTWKIFKGKTRAKRISSFLKPRRRRKANNKEKRPLALFVAFSWDTKQCQKFRCLNKEHCWSILDLGEEAAC